MKAGVVEGIENLVVKEIPVPEILPEKALVKVAYGGLCGPTDDAILKGLHPRVGFPAVLCHEFSGEIAAIGENEKGFHKGDKVVVNPLVFCNECETCRNGNQYICEDLKLIGIDFDGGFAEYCLVPTDNLVRIPEKLPLDIAALTEPVAVGIHAVREAGLQMGDSALIFGAGPIGLFVAEACRNSGAGNITILDIDKRRLELAESLGYEVADAPGKLDRPEGVRFNYVFETTGSQAVLKEVIHRVKIKGSIIVVGKFDFDVPLDLHAVLFHELTIKGVRVYRPQEFFTALGLLAREPVRYQKFISDYFPLQEIQQVFTVFRARKNLARMMVSF